MHQKQYKIQHFSSTVPIVEVGVLGQRELLEEAFRRWSLVHFSVLMTHTAPR